MSKAWKPRKPLSREEALAELQNLSEDRRREFLLVQEKWPIVSDHDGGISCRAMQEAVGLAMHRVGFYMRILDGLNATETAVPPRPKQTEPDIPANMVKAINVLVRETTERNQRASDAQIKAAEAEIADQAVQIEDLKYALDEMVSDANKLDDRQGALEQANARLRTERDEADERSKLLAAARQLVEEQSAALRTENMDLRQMNGLLSTELADTKHERDECRREGDRKSRLAEELGIKVAVLQEQTNHRAAELLKSDSLCRAQHEKHVRDCDLLRELLGDANKRIAYLETELSKFHVSSPATV